MLANFFCNLCTKNARCIFVGECGLLEYAAQRELSSINSSA